MPAEDCAALRQSSDLLSQLPLRRLYQLLLFPNLLRNSLLRATHTDDDSTNPWQVCTPLAA